MHVEVRVCVPALYGVCLARAPRVEGRHVQVAARNQVLPHRVTIGVGHGIAAHKQDWCLSANRHVRGVSAKRSRGEANSQNNNNKVDTQWAKPARVCLNATRCTGAMRTAPETTHKTTR